MRFCGGCGRPLDASAAPRVVPKEAPQRRHMTVMFCDLADSTPLAEALDPEDFREVLTDYRETCLRAVERFGGFTAVYAGDGMTVYFGYPRAHEDDAQRAVHTGLAILDGMASLNARLQDLWDISVEVRIGIHSGVVIAEELGGGAGQTASQLDVSGEMPHIASRIESVAPRGAVAISDATRDLVEGYFETEPLGEKMLKGVSRPIGVHRILGPTGAVGRLEVAASRRLTPIVGRKDELAQLSEAWQQIQQGHGAVAHVTGEAGIGKSRLVHELIATLGDHATVQRLQCSAHHKSTSLYPVGTFLERALGLGSTDSTEDQLEALGRAVVEAGLDPTESVPLVADLVSLPGSERGGGHALAPRDARTALLHVLESLLVSNPSKHPLLLVVDDLHWADPTTLELLSRILRTLHRLPVLCVATFRSDFTPPWAHDGSVLEIALGPLTATEVRAMAAAANGDVDPIVLDWVESTADGVPLFVEEMLKVRRAPSATSVPPTLEGLLTERLDRLPELADVIDMAAILGREFDRSHLAGLEPLPPAELEPALVQLAAQDVIRPVDGAPSRCEFAHGLLQEAAYGRILRRRRRTLHGRVAGILESGFADAVEREPEIVAHHWVAADEPAKAVPFWHAAGTRALERAAYLEAAAHFERGLEALDARTHADPVTRINFLTHIAASLQAGHGYAAAGVDAAYSRARTACERTGNSDRLVPVIRGECSFHLLRGQYAEALELTDELLALADSGVHVPLAEAHLFRGLVHMYMGNFGQARSHLEEAFAFYEPPLPSDHIYEAQGDTSVGSLAYLAVVLWNLGYAAEAEQRSDLSIERAARVGGPVTRAQAWGMRGILHLSRAEPAAFGQWVHKTNEHTVDHDIGYWRTVSSLLLGWFQGRAGQIEQGAARLHESLDVYLASGSRLGLPHFQLLAADLRRVAGDTQGALDLLSVGEEYIEETGERLSESELLRFKGRLLMVDHPDEATVAFERAMLTAREQDAKLLELQAGTRLAEHQAKLGDPCAVLERIAELCDWFSPAPHLADVDRARTLVATGTTAR
jgi:class 3 adenylate cyclase/tetratricopeptide (TPR) repeat protein